MKLRSFFFCLLAAAVFPCFALTVADGTESDYQIVIPDEISDKSLDGFVALGGKVIRTAVRKASGAELPLVREKDRIPGRPAIIIGNTRALEKAGFSTGQFAPWEYGIAVKGPDIYLYGKDLPNPLKGVRYPGYFIYYTLGSLKAVCEFTERFLNTRFTGVKKNAYGEYAGTCTLPLKKIEVPDNFSLRKKPRFLTHSGDTGGLLFSVANNFFFNPSAEFNVHYHEKAIPQAKYYKDHPEYFALINGKRYFHTSDGGSRPQYCLTNPDVQKLIYQNALERVDRGLKVIEFGQSDGFRPCECERCRKWYNTSDWGEKIWLFHRDLAERLQKDRPGVIPAIACYEVTHQLPKSFQTFPGKGVIVDIAPATPQLLKGFEKFNLRGMAAWTYVFGSYKACGYTPSNSFARLQKEAKFLYSTPVTSFLHCGLPDNNNISGPWIYAWGRMLENPELDTKGLLKDYCRFSFGEEAAPYWNRFFSLIDSRLEKYPLAELKIEGGYDPGKGNDFDGPKPQTAIELWNQRYPENVVKELDSLLGEALKRTDPENYMAKAVKVEYDYLRVSAAVCHAIAAMEKDNSYANRVRLADALEARTKFIDSLPRRSNNVQVEGDAFYGNYLSSLRSGGNMYGVFGGAFNSDPKILRNKLKSLELVKVTGFEDPAWTKIPAETLHPMAPGMTPVKAEFKAAYTEKALLFQMTAPVLGKVTGKAPEQDSFTIWDNEVWELFFATGRWMYQMVFNPLSGSRFDAVHYPKQKLRTQWNPEWKHEDTVQNGIWHSRVTIPFSSFDGYLKIGDLRQMQIGFSNHYPHAVYAWNPSMSGKFADLDGFGFFRIGKRGDAVRVIDINGDFAQTDSKGCIRNWFTYPLNCPLKRQNGHLAVKTPVKSYLQIGSHVCIPMEPDEKAVVTLHARGKGKINFGIGWSNNAGYWVVNDMSPYFSLTEESRKYQMEFQVGRHIQKNAAHFQLKILCDKPEVDLILESAEVKIIRKK